MGNIFDEKLIIWIDTLNRNKIPYKIVDYTIYWQTKHLTYEWDVSWGSKTKKHEEKFFDTIKSNRTLESILKQKGFNKIPEFLISD